MTVSVPTLLALPGAQAVAVKLPAAGTLQGVVAVLLPATVALPATQSAEV